jgi:hypothetical protein
MSPRCCICFLTDERYLLPTLLAAMQARRHTSANVADVAVFFVHGGAVSDRFRSYFADVSVEFIAVERRRTGAMPIHAARLFLDEILDARYSEILYLDADVQVTASLNELAGAVAPDGKFLAAPDPFVICRDWTSAQAQGLRRYYEGIGLAQEQLQNYFNSGVIRASRVVWREIAIAACKLIDARGEPFRFADQDALNLVAAGCCMPLSYRWNYPAFFRGFMPPDTIEPRIEHFMSDPRPWFGPFRPWGWRAYTPYVDLVAKHPELAPLMRASLFTHARYALQQEYKGWTERRAWGRPAVLARIAEMEKRAFL